ncbi:hypothetical protein LTR08_001890 [Meristemomyces frigidus]|nr:hypothetical protein LTR08_001890 [Meristemomyces frigidus]
MQMTSSLRLLQSDINGCLRTAILFELKIMQQSPSREEYESGIQAKLAEIAAKRAQRANAQMQMNPGMVVPHNMPNNGMADMQNGMLGMPNGQGGHNAGTQQNQAFPPQLQRQMQPSAIPLAQQRNNMDPPSLQPSVMQLQTPTMAQEQVQQPQTVNMGGQGGNGPPTTREIQEMAQIMYNRLGGEEQKNSLRARWMGTLTEQQLARANALTGVDPLLAYYFPGKARELLVRQRQGQQGQTQQQNGGNMSNGLGNNQPQPPTPQAGGPGIDYTGILGQQAIALKQQESGEQVVPASANFNVPGTGANIPQGVNPQTISNPQGNGQPVTNQVQQLVSQQQRQQYMQRQNILAQHHAQQQQQQANQLRGQPGGLNAPNALNGGPAGQTNSPAMSMLNRPMVPPGQDAPGTPQQNLPLGHPQQTPQNTATMHLMQHHQAMMNQNNQGAKPPNQGPNQGLNQQQQRHQETLQLLAILPPPLRQRVTENNMPLEDLRQLIVRFRQSQMNQPSANLINAPQGHQGVQNTAVTTHTPQQGMINGVPGQGMHGNATPMFNSQPPPTQQPHAPQMDPTLLQQRLQQQQQQQMQQQFRLRAMDMAPFPHAALAHLGVSVPQEIQTWGRLKAHLQQNQSVLPPNILEQAKGMQNQWFERPDEMTAAYQSLRTVMQQQQQQSQLQGPPGGQPQPPLQQPPVSGPAGLQMPNGQAPPAQMVPPPAPMQQPPTPQQGSGPQGLNQDQLTRPLNPQPPTMQEVQMAKQNVPGWAGHSDEDITNLIWNRKMQQFSVRMQQWQQQAQQQEATRNAQIQRAQMAAAQQKGGLPNDAQGRRPPQQPQPQHTPLIQQQLSGAMQKRTQQPSGSVISNDDVMEIPNPNAPPRAPMGMPQAPIMHTSKPQQQAPQTGPRRSLPMPTKEQFAQMSPEKQAQVHQVMQQHRLRDQNEALRKAQMGLTVSQQPQAPGPQPPGQQRGPLNATEVPLIPNRIQTMYAEVERANPKGFAVEIDSDELGQVQGLAKRLWHPVMTVQHTFTMAMRVPGAEQQLRDAMKVKVQILQNFADGDGAIRDYLSLSFQQLKGLETALSRYLGIMKMVRERVGQSNMGRQQLQPPNVTPAQAPSHPQGPQRSASAVLKAEHPPQKVPPPSAQQGHGRKPSGNKSKAPPAPTDNKTFDWLDPSPHGGLQHDAARQHELTSDRLKLPPNKKRKPNQPASQDSTPAAQMGTPGAAASPNVGTVKAASPEQTKKQPKHTMEEMAERAREEQRKWRCRNMLCQASISGFEKEEELKSHMDAEHAPIDDPMAFMLENAASALGVDQEGKLLPVQTSADVKPHPRAVPVASVRKGAKHESAMPPGVRPTARGKGKRAITPAPAEEPPITEKTLRAVLEAQLGYVHPAKLEEKGAGTSDTASSDAAKLQDGGGWEDPLQGTLAGAADIDDDDDSSLFGESEGADWALLTSSDSSPESVGTASSRASDISANERLRINMEWDAFGNGDTHAPDGLGTLRLGSNDSSPELGKAGENTNVAGAASKEDGKVADEFEWSRDEESDWATLFGENAGLDDMDVDRGLSFDM